MAERIPASERTHQRLTDLLERGVAGGDARAELIKLAVRTIVEEALEAEVTDASAPALRLCPHPAAADARPRLLAPRGPQFRT